MLPEQKELFSLTFRYEVDLKTIAKDTSFIEKITFNRINATAKDAGDWLEHVVQHPDGGATNLSTT